MENASTALLIAGGVLLAILILSIGVLACSTVTNFQDQQQTKALSEEITKFNEGFLAYNKTRMFGTDIISVVNKAIDNNKRKQATTDNPYYVNIIIDIKDEFQTTGMVMDSSKTIESGEHEKNMTDQQIVDVTKNPIDTKSISKGTWKLGEWTPANELQMNQGIVSFFNQDVNNKIITNGTKTYYIYTALSNFKKVIFKCENVRYNEEGRITEMIFTQI